MGSGSFIKPTKLTPRKSFVEALHERYVTFDTPELTLPDSTLPGMFVSTSKGNMKKIELIGEKKIRKYQQISTIDKVLIRNDSIATAGKNLNTIASHFIEVDLQDNLISEWNEIFNLTTQLPQLESLLLQGNRLQPFTTNLSETLPPNGMSHIKRLALNNTGISSWKCIERIEKFLPYLEEFYITQSCLWDIPSIDDQWLNQTQTQIQIEQSSSALSSTATTIVTNNAATTTTTTTMITSADTRDIELIKTSISDHDVDILNKLSIKGFHHLKVLDISSCQIESWNQIILFGHLLLLEQLILDNNPIPAITNLQSVVPYTSTTTPITTTTTANNTIFKNLNRLSLMSTKLSSWQDINNLMSLPQLTNLRCSDIPLFIGMGSSECRPLVLGRLHQLTTFNGSSISERERREAEKTYLRSIIKSSLKEQEKRPKNDPKIPENGSKTDEEYISLNEHPRYKELILKYGDDTSFNTIFTSINTVKGIAGDLIEITFKCINGAFDQPVVKKIPSTITIIRLKMMLKQLFLIEPDLQQLSMRTDKESFPTVLDDDESTLAYYGIIDGAEVFINEV